jgi:hypothetical protein
MNYIHVRDGLSLPANRRSEWHPVNEMKSTLFFGRHEDRIAADTFPETFAAVCSPGTTQEPTVIERFSASRQSNEFCAHLQRRD